MIDLSSPVEKTIKLIDLCLSSCDGSISSEEAAKALDCTVRTARRIFHQLDNMSYEIYNLNIKLLKKGYGECVRLQVLNK